jgi:hypothetical protein
VVVVSGSAGLTAAFLMTGSDGGAILFSVLLLVCYRDGGRSILGSF